MCIYSFRMIYQTKRNIHLELKKKKKKKLVKDGKRKHEKLEIFFFFVFFSLLLFLRVLIHRHIKPIWNEIVILCERERCRCKWLLCFFFPRFAPFVPTNIIVELVRCCCFPLSEEIWTSSCFNQTLIIFVAFHEFEINVRGRLKVGAEHFLQSRRFAMTTKKFCFKQN